MNAKVNILFIGDYCRNDYLRLLIDAVPYCNFYFLFYSSPKEEKNKNHVFYGKAIYWKDFRDTTTLLKKVSPHKVLFLYIDSYNNLVLNIACKHAGIPTYHLEHGMRADYAISYELNISPHLYQKPFKKIADTIILLKNLRARIKSHLFLHNSIKALPEEDAVVVEKFIELRSKHSYLETFRQLSSPKRTADSYISFSPAVFKVHKKYDHLKEDCQVHFIGVPYFDAFSTIKAGQAQKAILFIDQPLAEHRLLTWTPEYKREFAKQIKAICTAYGYKLYLKPHPQQDISLWMGNEGNSFAIVDDATLMSLAAHIPLIIGFYSTYLMPFAAMEHTTLLTFENHPAGKLDVSKPFTDAGVAHPIYNLEQLQEAFSKIDQLHQQQLPNKAKFTEEWLYKFDGKAGERLRDILLGKAA